MIQLRITTTTKGYHPSAEWQGSGERTETFIDIESALAYLKEQYCNCSREKIFIDRKDGTSAHCGWIYGFRTADWSHLPVEHWLQRDWVAFYRVEPIELS